MVRPPLGQPGHAQRQRSPAPDAPALETEEAALVVAPPSAEQAESVSGCGEIAMAEASAKSSFTARSRLSRSARSATSAVIAAASARVAPSRRSTGSWPLCRSSPVLDRVSRKHPLVLRIVAVLALRGVLHFAKLLFVLVRFVRAVPPRERRIRVRLHVRIGVIVARRQPVAAARGTLGLQTNLNRCAGSDRAGASRRRPPQAIPLAQTCVAERPPQAIPLAQTCVAEP
jgi:hypothetical protein